MRRVITAIGVVAGTLAVVLTSAALAGGHARAAADHRVVIRNYTYSPGRLVVRRNDSVTWVFDDGSVLHNVVGSRFRSSPVKKTGTYTVRFTRTGTYTYTCTLHPWMSGSVVVH